MPAEIERGEKYFVSTTHWGTLMRLLPVALLLLSGGSIASAAAIFANGSPDTNAPNSSSIDIFRSADNFVLSNPANLTSIRLWLVTQSGEFQGSLTYAIYENSAGALGNLIQSNTVSGITPVLLNQIPGDIHSISVVDFDLPAPLVLGAGSYWLEIHHGSSLTSGTGFPNVLWAVVGGGGGGDAKRNPIPGLPTNSVNIELAFELFDSSGAAPSGAVPEPATIAISLAGLAAIGFLQRRRF